MTDYLFSFAVLIFIIATCMHKTLGGAQFGARYYLDMIPYLAMYLATQKINAKFVIAQLEVCLFSLGLNIYGIYFVISNFAIK